MGLWEHQGNWDLHITGEKIVALRHAPDDRPEDYRASFPNLAREPEPEEKSP